MITKKSIRKLLSEFKNGSPFDWKINHFYLLVDEEYCDIIVDYVGQGVDSRIYNGDYVKLVDITQEFCSYRGLGGYLNLKLSTDKIYSSIEMYL